MLSEDLNSLGIRRENIAEFARLDMIDLGFDDRWAVARLIANCSNKEIN
jgi:hypothetical protein